MDPQVIEGVQEKHEAVTRSVNSSLMHIKQHSQHLIKPLNIYHRDFIDHKILTEV